MTGDAAIAPRWLQRTADDGLGCYVHLPFCDRICPYCDFAVVRFHEERVARYLSALQREIASHKPDGRPLQTIYLGGGTPSALQPQHIGALVSALRSAFHTPLDAGEVTLEANPSRNIEALPLWRASGVNRLSIGVQSFNDAELHALGRDHSGAQALAFAAAARTAGFGNISLDLIAAVPGQTLASLLDSLRQAVRCGAAHISVYGLTIEAATPYASWFARDPLAFPDDDATAELLEAAAAYLEREGYAHYEVSNFARPGFESAHNYGYWRQRDCLAFGLSAAGYDAGTRYRNVRDFERYCEALERGADPRADEEHLGAAQRIGEAAMLALRTGQGLGYEDFRRRFDVDAARIFARAINKCMAAGLLEGDDGGVRLSRRGRLLANSVCTEFLVPEQMAVTQP